MNSRGSVSGSENGWSRRKLDKTLWVAARLFQNVADRLSKQPKNVPGRWYVDTGRHSDSTHSPAFEVGTAAKPIEIKPHRWGWKAFEAPGVEPVFPKKDQAIDYAQNRACFRSGEIRILDASGNVERIIQFNETDRRL